MKPNKGTYTISKISILAVLIFVLVAFGICINYIRTLKASVPAPSELLRENSSKYRLINPLLLAGDKFDNSVTEYIVLHEKINSYIRQIKGKNGITDVSVYFRDLNTAKWTGINEEDKYAPGSMLKVAVVLGYLKYGEHNPSILDQRYYYKPVVDPGQFYTPQAMLKEGNQRVGDLIKNMIINSDNAATLLLIDKNKQAVNDVYQDLKLPLPEGAIDFMSAKSYSVLFRVLYNGTYLTKDLSEQSLTLLTLTAFKDGLVAGVPEGTIVAHKFGEHTNDLPDVHSVHELHDCGIIYPKERSPYFLCVMSRGSEFKSLEGVISGISKLVYEHVVTNNLLGPK